MKHTPKENGGWAPMHQVDFLCTPWLRLQLRSSAGWWYFQLARFNCKHIFHTSSVWMKNVSIPHFQSSRPERKSTMCGVWVRMAPYHFNAVFLAWFSVTLTKEGTYGSGSRVVLIHHELMKMHVCGGCGLHGCIFSIPTLTKNSYNL